MKRRDFSLSVVLVAGAAGASTLVIPPVSTTPSVSTGTPRTATSQQATVGALKEGTDYLLLANSASTQAPAGKIEVVEFFWYNCGHCNKFEPALEAWAKKLPKDVLLRRVPIAFRPSFEPQQRLFYALETLGVVEQMHKKVFSAIHDDKQNLDTPESILAWVQKQPAIDKNKFSEAFASFSVADKARKAKALLEAYKVDGVPCLGVAGKYLTSGALAGSMERALLVTERLIEMEKGPRAAPAGTSSKYSLSFGK